MDAQVRPAASKVAKPATVRPRSYYNDTFHKSGSYAIQRRAGTVLVKWSQAPFTPGVRYPAGSKAIKFVVYLNGKKFGQPQLSWIDSKGIVHARLRHGAFVSDLRSPSSVLSAHFKLLLATVLQIKAENKKIQKGGLRALGTPIKDIDGKITTKGALMLAALIKSLGQKNVANKTSALGARTFDNINRLLRMEGMGDIVHRIADLIGLKVHVNKKTRGRRLGQGESSAMGAARGRRERARRAQTMDALLANAPPPPWRDDLQRMVFDEPYTTREAARNQLRPRALALVRRALNNQEQRHDYAEALAQYLLHRTDIYTTPPARSWMLTGAIEELLDAYDGFRNGEMTHAEFLEQRAEAIKWCFKGRIRVPISDMVQVLERLPGFQRTEAELQEPVNDMLEHMWPMRRVAADLQAEVNVPLEVMRYVFLFALGVALSPAGL